MDVHIDQVEADITSPAAPATGAPAHGGAAQPARTPEAEADRLREHIHQIGQRRDRLRAD